MMFKHDRATSSPRHGGARTRDYLIAVRYLVSPFIVTPTSSYLRPNASIYLRRRDISTRVMLLLAHFCISDSTEYLMYYRFTFYSFIVAFALPTRATCNSRKAQAAPPPISPV